MFQTHLQLSDIIIADRRKAAPIGSSELLRVQFTSC
jgi:hypothetical protein